MSPETERGAVSCEGTELTVAEAVERLRHALDLADLALTGPDPHLAALYLTDAIYAASAALPDVQLVPRPTIRPVA